VEEPRVKMSSWHEQVRLRQSQHLVAMREESLFYAFHSDSYCRCRRRPQDGRQRQEERRRSLSRDLRAKHEADEVDGEASSKGRKLYPSQTLGRIVARLTRRPKAEAATVKWAINEEHHFDVKANQLQALSWYRRLQAAQRPQRYASFFFF